MITFNNNIYLPFSKKALIIIGLCGITLIIMQQGVYGELFITVECFHHLMPSFSGIVVLVIRAFHGGRAQRYSVGTAAYRYAHLNLPSTLGAAMVEFPF